MLSDRLDINSGEINTTGASFTLKHSPSAKKMDNPPAGHVGHHYFLKPRESTRVNIEFGSYTEGTFSTLVILRNNLTVIDALPVYGHGVAPKFTVNERLPNEEKSELQIAATKSELLNCRTQDGNFTEKLSINRTFTLHNGGVLPLDIDAIYINKKKCSGFGFAITPCEPFILEPNTSTRINVSFTPDYTLYRVVRQIQFSTKTTGELTYNIISNVPHEMLAVCRPHQPRPAWEAQLKQILVVVCMFAVTCASLAGSQFTMAYFSAPQETPSKAISKEVNTPGLRRSRKADYKLQKSQSAKSNSCDSSSKLPKKKPDGSSGAPSCSSSSELKRSQSDGLNAHPDDNSKDYLSDSSSCQASPRPERHITQDEIHPESGIQNKCKAPGKGKKLSFQQASSTSEVSPSPVEVLDSKSRLLGRSPSLSNGDKPDTSNLSSPKQGRRSTKAQLREEKRERQRQMEKERQLIRLDQRYAMQLAAEDSGLSPDKSLSHTSSNDRNELLRTVSDSPTMPETQHVHTEGQQKCRHANCHVVDSILASVNVNASDESRQSSPLPYLPAKGQEQSGTTTSPKSKGKLAQAMNVVTPPKNLPLSLDDNEPAAPSSGPSSPHSLASHLAEKMYGPGKVPSSTVAPTASSEKHLAYSSSSSKFFPASSKSKELRVMQVSPFIKPNEAPEKSPAKPQAWNKTATAVLSESAPNTKKSDRRGYAQEPEKQWPSHGSFNSQKPPAMQQSWPGQLPLPSFLQYKRQAKRADAHLHASDFDTWTAYEEFCQAHAAEAADMSPPIETAPFPAFKQPGTGFVPPNPKHMPSGYGPLIGSLSRMSRKSMAWRMLQLGMSSPPSSDSSPTELCPPVPLGQQLPEYSTWSVNDSSSDRRAKEKLHYQQQQQQWQQHLQQRRELQERQQKHGQMLHHHQQQKYEEQRKNAFEFSGDLRTLWERNACRRDGNVTVGQSWKQDELSSIWNDAPEDKKDTEEAPIADDIIVAEQPEEAPILEEDGEERDDQETQEFSLFGGSNVWHFSPPWKTPFAE